MTWLFKLRYRSTDVILQYLKQAAVGYIAPIQTVEQKLNKTVYRKHTKLREQYLLQHKF